MLLQDIIDSMNKALLVQKWNEGDRGHRIGHPFYWVDVENSPSWMRITEPAAILNTLSMCYEIYPTPAEIQVSDLEEMRGRIHETVAGFIGWLYPFLQHSEYEKYFAGTANTRSQDYAFIRTNSDLKNGIRHLDIGPGMGSHSIYSCFGFQSKYFGLEAYPMTYQVQRNFLKYLAMIENTTYFDSVMAESFGVNDDEIAERYQADGGGLFHVPSWKFPLVSDRNIDLVTATWVLNEVSHAGIIWLLGNAMRVLRPGGWFYIRDSGVVKPGRHNVNYDSLLQEFGFEEKARLNTKNRVDYYGVPRIFQKVRDVNIPDFDTLVSQTLDRMHVTVHTGEYNDRLPS